MTKINSFDDLRQWVRGKRGRNVSIELGQPTNNNYESIWVYDYELGAGQHITIPGEITFYDKYEENIKEKIEELQSKLQRFKEMEAV